MECGRKSVTITSHGFMSYLWFYRSAYNLSQADQAMVWVKEERGRCLCVLFSNSTNCVCLHVFTSFVSEGWGRKKGRCVFLISSPVVTPLNPPLKLSHNNGEWLTGAAMVKQSKNGGINWIKWRSWSIF